MPAPAEPAAPLPNPPTYASAAAPGAPTNMARGRFGLFDQSVLTGPLGALATSQTSKRTILG